MISQILIILGLLVLYVASIIALNFTDMRAWKNSASLMFSSEEEHRDEQV